MFTDHEIVATDRAVVTDTAVIAIIARRHARGHAIAIHAAAARAIVITTRRRLAIIAASARTRSIAICSESAIVSARNVTGIHADGAHRLDDSVV